MARDILSDYGRDSNQRQAARPTNGGRQDPKPTNYSPPKGPHDQYHEGPGLGGGDNHGTCGTQGRH